MERSIRIDRVVILRGDAPEPDRLPHQHGDALGPHLLHDLGAIAFDRPHTDLQLGGNCETREPFHNQIENFDLSRRQSCEPFAESILCLGRTMPLKPLREGSVDRRNELGVVNRFFNEIFRSGLYGRHSHRHVRVTGNENDRECDILTSELANEAEAVHPGHSHIRDNASNVPVIKHLKKSVGRLEGLDAVANTLSFLELDLNPAFAGGDFHIPIMVGISDDDVSASQNVTSAREQRGCAIAG